MIFFPGISHTQGPYQVLKLPIIAGPDWTEPYHGPESSGLGELLGFTLLTREDERKEEKMMNCLSIQSERKLSTCIGKREKENPMPTTKAGA